MKDRLAPTLNLWTPDARGRVDDAIRHLLSRDIVSAGGKLYPIDRPAPPPPPPPPKPKPVDPAILLYRRERDKRAPQREAERERLRQILDDAERRATAGPRRHMPNINVRREAV